jgi:hypothetical protein
VVDWAVPADPAPVDPVPVDPVPADAVPVEAGAVVVVVVVAAFEGTGHGQDVPGLHVHHHRRPAVGV